MKISRMNDKKNFTQIKNSLILSSDLDDSEFRLLTYLLSKNNNWKFSKYGASKELKWKVKKIDRVKSQLKKKGYFTEKQISSTEYEYYVRESPDLDFHASLKNGYPENGYPENGYPENGEHNNTNTNNNTNNINKTKLTKEIINDVQGENINTETDTLDKEIIKLILITEQYGISNKSIIESWAKDFSLSLVSEVINNLDTYLKNKEPKSIKNYIYGILKRKSEENNNLPVKEKTEPDKRLEYLQDRFIIRSSRKEDIYKEFIRQLLSDSHSFNPEIDTILPEHEYKYLKLNRIYSPDEINIILADTLANLNDLDKRFKKEFIKALKEPINKVSAKVNNFIEVINKGN